MATFTPQNKREALAVMIATAFHDEAQVTLYLQYCRKYPLQSVYRAFAEAQSVPLAQVKKSRAAIFFYLIKRYTHDPHTQPPPGAEAGNP